MASIFFFFIIKTLIKIQEPYSFIHNHFFTLNNDMTKFLGSY